MLTLAIPSKGRLKDNCNAWFEARGLRMEQAVGARGYRANFTGFADIEVMLLSASEIASSLLAGDIHLGITGEDLLREEARELRGRMHLIKPLGFGFADVVVAVSQYWIDVATMADLDDVCAAYAQAHRKRLRVAKARSLMALIRPSASSNTLLKSKSAMSSGGSLAKSNSPDT